MKVLATWEDSVEEKCLVQSLGNVHRHSEIPANESQNITKLSSPPPQSVSSITVLSYSTILDVEGVLYKCHNSRCPTLNNMHIAL